MNIGEQLEQFTASISNFDEKRNYISLSNIHKPVEELIADYQNGYTADLTGRLKCYKGYQMEKDLVSRIKNVFKERIDTSYEISIFDGLVKGHTDFTFDAFPGECKSVLKDDYLPKDNRLPNKVFWQVQGYMLYMSKPKALVVYESRESGLISSLWVSQNSNVQEMIDRKVRIIVSSIKK